MVKVTYLSRLKRHGYENTTVNCKIYSVWAEHSSKNVSSKGLSWSHILTLVIQNLLSS
jgi:hypothetical protein